MTQRLSEMHAEWLENQRGLSIDIATRFGLASKDDELGFPYIENGIVKYWKIRKIDKSSMRIAPSGSKQILYNIDELSEASGRNQTLVITEGELDCIAIAHTGIHTVSVPNGAPAKIGEGDINPIEDTGFGYLWVGDKIHPNVSKFDRIVLFGDNDGPGQNLQEELAIRLGRHKCFIPVYPDDCKDPNEILIKHGTEILSKIIRDARAIVPDKLVRFSEIPLTIREKGLNSGWRGLDEHLLLTFPELVTITGTPSAGKSQWSLAWLCNLARLYNIKTAILQFEDSPARNKVDLLNYAKSFKDQIHEDPEDWVDDRFITKVPPDAVNDEEPITLEWLRDAIEQAACRHSCKVVLIDPWNEIEHAWGRGQSETQYTNDALRELKRLARQFQIAIVVVTHPSASVKHKDLSELTLYDVAGSAAWRNKSDHGIIIYREDGSSETQVKVSKCKDFATMGSPGTVTMRFVPNQARFEFVRKGV